MKHTVKKIMALIFSGLVLFAAASMNAFAETKNVLSYKVTNGQATIVFCDRNIKGKLIIPDSLGGFPVTGISSVAFCWCYWLTSINIPASVTSFNGGFRGCDNLESIVVDTGNPTFASENGVLFNKSKTELIQCPSSKTGSYTIPNSVTSIGNGAFYECKRLENIIVPDSVTSIGESAFYGTPLHDDYTKGLVYIGKVAYQYCGDMPENTSIRLKSGTVSIADGAFNGCYGLKQITIPTSVTKIGYLAFYYCTGLESISVSKSNKAYTSENGVLFNKSKTKLIQYPVGKSGSSYTIPNSVKSIGSEAFQECEGLTSVTIPNGVTSIGDSAFAGCNELSSISIPDSVTSIGDGAFAFCGGLTSIVIPEGVKTIGENAFYDCEGLKSITIPESVTSIGDGAFYSCVKLKSITIPNSVTNIGDGAFDDCTGLISINVSNANKAYTSENGVLFNKFKTELIRYPSSKTGSSYIIPDGVTSIGKRAFWNCDGLKSITFPDSVASIGDEALVDTAWYDNQPGGVVYAGKVACGYNGEIPRNTFIVIKPGTIGIAEGAFEIKGSEGDNYGLIGVSIPTTVTNIGYHAFYSCGKLKSVIIPKSVVSIGDQAFGYCDSLDWEYKISDLTFSCFANSAGLKYARENGFACDILPASTIITSPTVPATDPTETNEDTTDTASPTETNTDSTETTTPADSRSIGDQVIMAAVILTAVLCCAAVATPVIVAIKKKKKK